MFIFLVNKFVQLFSVLVSASKVGISKAVYPAPNLFWCGACAPKNYFPPYLLKVYPAPYLFWCRVYPVPYSFWCEVYIEPEEPFE